jgi:hypothetical protein
MSGQFYYIENANATKSIQDIIEASSITPLSNISPYFINFSGTSQPADANTGYFKPNNFGFTIAGNDVSQYFQAIYDEYNSVGSFNKTIPQGVNQVKVICVGSGGGGGGGGGGRYRNNAWGGSNRRSSVGGAGGGGGGYTIGSLPVSAGDILEIRVPSGGNGGNGGAGNNAGNGNRGDSGSSAYVKNLTSFLELIANGGTYGDGGAGGTNSGTSTAGSGGTGNLTTGNGGNSGNASSDGDKPGPAGSGGTINNSSGWPIFQQSSGPNVIGGGGNGGGGGHGSGSGGPGSSGGPGFCRVYYLY